MMTVACAVRPSLSSISRVAFAALALVLAACGVTPTSHTTFTDDGGGLCAFGGCPDLNMAKSCAADKDCANPTPRCDPQSKICVACIDPAGSDCPAGSLCDAKTHACVPGCSKAHGCGDGGACEADAGTCVECVADADCRDPMRKRCDPATHACSACLPSNDDCPVGNYCAPAKTEYACATGCRDDMDCAGDGGVTRCEKTKHACVACLADDDCAIGTVCKGNACVPGCSANHGCDANLTCCGGACVSLTADKGNCGACGKACGANETCCTGLCSNVANDAMNCGACGMACMVANAVAACANSTCGLASCQAGFSDCDNNAKNGCEINIASDLNNCGGCGSLCKRANAVPLCTGGNCQIGQCNAGFKDCDNDVSDGCEVNVAGDVNNCGACGTRCNVANGTPACVAAACKVSACSAGFGDCDLAYGNGCEVNTNTSLAHCGGCNKPCALANATPACTAGACGIASCNANFGNCDGATANGCEVNLQTDAKNCGACNLVCPNGQMCVAGKCQLGCGNQIVDDGNLLCVPAGQTYTLSGDKCYASAIIVNGALVVSNNGGSLILRSPNITVAQGGRIVADAVGRPGGLAAAANGGLQGAGPGLGCGGGPGSSVGQGGSGGGYGGAGGTPKQPTQWTAACNMCNNPTLAHCFGPGGSPYGTQAGTDYDLGSSGGAGGNSSGCTNAGGRGGAGGGAVVLLGKTVKIDGAVTATGEKPPVDPNACGYHPGGGGGSGGTVIVRADSLSGAGTLGSAGGAGGDATGQSNDWGWAGGGGGGGRVKVFASVSSFTGVLDAGAGAGGGNGGVCTGTYCYSGMPGAAGTTYTSQTIPAMWTLIGCAGQ